MFKQQYDYIIVGSGSAGCVVANRLSADPKCNVLLLETGKHSRSIWLRLPIGYFRTIYDDRFSRVFDTEPGKYNGNRNVLCPRGRVVGGSSMINGLVFIRGQREDFDGWESQGASGWGFEDVLPYFKRIETWQDGANQYRGDSGEISVSDLRQDNPHCSAWLVAAQQYGLPKNSDPNAESTYGVCNHQLSIRDRWRCSAEMAFLRPIQQRPNLTVLTQAHVTRVMFNETAAKGVEWSRQGKIETALAGKEVILSAGAIQTPQILQLSGVGPKELLQDHGIEIVANSPDVGSNLQDHYQIRALLKMKGKQSLNNHVRNPLRLAEMAWKWMASGRGALTVGAGQVGGGACTKYAQRNRPDIQFNVMPLSVDKPGTPLHSYSGFTTSFWQCHPQSRGSVIIRSKDPFEAPRITPNYLDQAFDRKVMVEGLKITREIHNQPAFKNRWEQETLPGQECVSNEQMEEQICNHGSTVFHMTGSCRMGSDDKAVVDPKLRVRGVQNLRVIDASIMPKITFANTNAPTLMIGEKGADLIKSSESS